MNMFSIPKRFRVHELPSNVLLGCCVTPPITGRVLQRRQGQTCLNFAVAGGAAATGRKRRHIHRKSKDIAGTWPVGWRTGRHGEVGPHRRP